jgi:PhnB protein
MSTTILPRLIVPNVADAVAYHAEVLGAEETFRFTEPSGSVAHCELTIGASAVSLAQANDDYRLYAPQTLNWSAMTAAGATVVVPIEDRAYGRREGRIRDPFGHLWVVSQAL